MPMFEEIVTPEGLARSKPDPAIYFRALERMGLAASEVLVFEDTNAGLAAASFVSCWHYAR